jgi:hypothetical protein
MVIVIPAAIGGAITAVLRFTEHPLVAYILIISFLVADGALSFGLNWQGITGTLFSTVLFLIGFPLVVYSWQLLLVFAIFPVLMFLVDASKT